MNNFNSFYCPLFPSIHYEVKILQLRGFFPFLFIYYQQDCICAANCHFVLYSHIGVILTGFIALWNIHKERSILPQPLPSIFYCLELSFLSIISPHASGTRLVVTQEGIKAAAYVDSHLYIIVVFISFYMGMFSYIDLFLFWGSFSQGRFE